MRNGANQHLKSKKMKDNSNSDHSTDSDDDTSSSSDGSDDTTTDDDSTNRLTSTPFSCNARKSGNHDGKGTKNKNCGKIVGKVSKNYGADDPKNQAYVGVQKIIFS